MSNSIQKFVNGGICIFIALCVLNFVMIPVRKQQLADKLEAIDTEQRERQEKFDAMCLSNAKQKLVSYFPTDRYSLEFISIGPSDLRFRSHESLDMVVVVTNLRSMNFNRIEIEMYKCDRDAAILRGTVVNLQTQERKDLTLNNMHPK